MGQRLLGFGAGRGEISNQCYDYEDFLSPMISSLFGFLFLALSFVQVPQWDNDWTKCSVAVPDTACHWYVVNPDNTFGKGFSWITAPQFDVASLRDIGVQHDVTVSQGFQTTVELMNASTQVKYGDNY